MPMPRAPCISAKEQPSASSNQSSTVALIISK
jgi:hypothetical protein